MDIPYEELEFDISTIVSLDSEEEINLKRQKLIDFIFGKAGLPQNQLPDSIEQAISDDDFKNLLNIERIDKLTINMEWNLNSIVYHFVPQNSRQEAVIYHQGHTGKFVNGISTIQIFLSKGYDVVALSMPLKGLNKKPIVHFPRFGKMMIVSHEQMSFLTPSSGHPVRFFIDPVIVMLNYLEMKGFRDIIMTGISGGGWTTTLSAALETRILKSYPVAGSLPFYLRSRDVHNNSTFGDYEQYIPELYRIANYIDLYVMGSFGNKRNQLQILNQFDSCCFSGTGYTTYVNLIKEKMGRLGKGKFDVFLDSSHREHKISETALDVIFKDLNN
jgi:hypothetical protein